MEMFYKCKRFVIECKKHFKMWWRMVPWANWPWGSTFLPMTLIQNFKISCKPILLFELIYMLISTVSVCDFC